MPQLSIIAMRTHADMCVCVCVCVIGAVSMYTHAYTHTHTHLSTRHTVKLKHCVPAPLSTQEHASMPLPPSPSTSSPQSAAQHCERNAFSHALKTETTSHVFHACIPKFGVGDGEGGGTLHVPQRFKRHADRFRRSSPTTTLDTSRVGVDAV